MAYPQTEGRYRKSYRQLGTLLLAAIWFAAPLQPSSGRAETTSTVVSPPQPATAPSTATEAIDPSLSPECRVPGSKLYTLARLRAVKAALAEKRPVRVLSVGSSSAGLGASSSYPIRLENALERALPNVDIEVDSRGLPGEIARGAAERLRSMLAETEPDLVVWQVGANDALARVELDAFSEALDESIRYVKSHNIDIVLIDPLFTRSMADDEYYNDLVRKVQEVAQREGIPLVRRYEAMRFLSSAGAGKFEDHMLGQQFRLNDLGLRCMAEHVARAITLSLLQSSPAATGDVKTAPQQAGPPSTDDKLDGR